MSSFSVFYRAHRNISRPHSESWAEELLESGLLLEWRCLHQNLWWCKHRHYFGKQKSAVKRAKFSFSKTKILPFLPQGFCFTFTNINVLSAFVRTNSLSLFFDYCRWTLCTKTKVEAYFPTSTTILWTYWRYRSSKICFGGRIVIVLLDKFIVLLPLFY